LQVQVENQALPSLGDVDRLIARLRLASGDFETLFRRYQQPASALRHYGLLQWQGAQLTEALEAFRAALALKGDDGDLWRDLAGVYESMADPISSEFCIRTSLNYQPRDPRTWLLLANLCSQAGRQDDAAAAFERAITFDPASGDAHFGLGLLQFGRLQLNEAVTSLTLAISHGYANAMGYAALGHVQYISGDFAGCAASFENAMRFGPLAANPRRKYARVRTLLTIIEGNIEQAITDYPDLAGEAPEDMADILRDAFSQLSAYGYPEAAAAVGRFRLAQNPDDATQRYLLDAVSGEPLVRAPPDYIESHFDRFAATFDQKLVQVLQYDAPALMARLIARERRTFDTILDLGCGTGLAAAHLAPFGGRMIGVDIAGRMLEEAAKRQCYADLEKAEALEFLAAHSARFDLVFAADVLVYFGDLALLFEAVARALRPGGIFAMSVETAVGEGYRVLASGRFAHAPEYIEKLAAAHFKVLAKQGGTIRLEAGRPADGIYLVLERLRQ
jgi:predicted TPR repeat methyltransferase